jgi:hypothetical protein
MLLLLVLTFLSLIEGSPPATAFCKLKTATLAKKQNAKSMLLFFKKRM